MEGGGGRVDKLEEAGGGFWAGGIEHHGEEERKGENNLPRPASARNRSGLRPGGCSSALTASRGALIWACSKLFDKSFAHQRWSRVISSTGLPRYLLYICDGIKLIVSNKAFGIVCSASSNSVFDGRLAYVPALEDVLVWDVKKGQMVRLTHCIPEILLKRN